MSYFYARAKELAGPGVTVDERKFRHAGPKPQSREAALIMLADGVEASVRSLSARDEPAIRAMVSADHRGAHDRRPVRRMRPDAARPRADPRGVRRPAARDVPHPRSPTRRTRSSSSNRGGRPRRRRRQHRVRRGRRPGLVTRAVYRGPWRVDLTVRDGVTAPSRAMPLARAVAAALDAGGAPSPASIGLILSDDTELGGAQRGPPGRDRSDGRAVVPAPAARGVPGPSGRGGSRCQVAAVAFALPPGRRPHLGDIVISVERAIAQADGRPRRPDRRRPLVAGRRAAAAGDPRHAPRLRLGPRRPDRGGRDARPREARAGLAQASGTPHVAGDRVGRAGAALLPSAQALPAWDRALSCCPRRIG